MRHRTELDALGTHWWIEFDGENVSPQDVCATIVELVRTFEESYSRFKPASLLSQLNDKKELKKPPEELVSMLKFALQMYSATNGVFNCSVGAVLEQNGYGKYADKAARTSTDLLKDISVQKDIIMVAPYIRLDFGGFGKGWLVDSLGKMLASSGCNEYIVNGGGDILAHTKKPERFALEHPYDSTLMIGEILLQDGALAASSPLKRTWKKDGKQHNHLVGSANTTGVIAGFVTAKTALYADVLSTVFLLTEVADRQALATRYGAEYLQIKTDMSAVQSPGFGAQLY